MSPPVRRVVLDANVLFPASLRDTLLRCVQSGLVDAFWSAEILNELERSLAATGAMPAERAKSLIDALIKVFPTAEVTGHARHIPFLRNDPADRHVAAAAVEAGADAVVTMNLKDFTPLPDGVTAISPADLLLELLDHDSARVLQILTEQHAALRNPPYTFAEMLAALERFVQPFVEAVRARLGE